MSSKKSYCFLPQVVKLPAGRDLSMDYPYKLNRQPSENPRCLIGSPSEKSLLPVS